MACKPPASWILAPAGAAPAPELTEFLAGLPSEAAQPALLRQAFTQYFEACKTHEPAEKQYAAYLGNCFAVWHEHVRLEPYIQGAMPLIIKRCVTQRLLQFDIGPLRLAVAQDVSGTLAAPVAPSSAHASAALGLLRSVSGHALDGAKTLTGTAARDWTQLKERMRYVFALFHAFHTEPQVRLAPYEPDQLAAIGTGQYPAGAWR